MSEENIGDIFSKIQTVLSDHQGYFYPDHENGIGMATFIKKNIAIENVERIFIHRWMNAFENDDYRTIGKSLEYVKLKVGERSFLIANMHGLWNGAGKTDTPDRIAQSNKVKELLDGFNGPKILCGDFNLSPDTESIKILEKDMKNLITEYGVQSTRSSYYPKDNKFADYILVSPDVQVKDFKVFPDEVSDHLALYLEFN